MPEPLPFRLGSIEIVEDEEYQQVIDSGFTPVVARCTTCGATHKTSVRNPDREDLVAMAHRLDRWSCTRRGHGVPW